LKITKISAISYFSTTYANNGRDSVTLAQYPRLANNKADNVTCNILNKYKDMESDNLNFG
jgi:hypothetical protein